MSARGMGVRYTLTSHGAPLRQAPSARERQQLLDSYYHPHHERLTAAVDAAVEAWNACLVIDCHSFASAALPYELDQSPKRPEICLGTDAFHTPEALATGARQAFESAGFRVAMDRPFAGALVPAKHYGRDRRVAALMIEVNRGLYMDEATGERRPDFELVRTRLLDVMQRINSTFMARVRM